MRNEDKYLVVHNIKLGRNRWEFPGGKCDPTDVNSCHTALRELEEECGVSTLGQNHFVCEVEMMVGPDTCADEVSSCWVGDFWLIDFRNIIGEVHIPESEKHKCDKFKWVTSEEFANLPQIPMVGVDVARKADRLLA